MNMIILIILVVVMAIRMIYHGDIVHWARIALLKVTINNVDEFNNNSNNN